MNGTLLERLRRWLCRNLGHRGRIYDCPCGSKPEVCTRCRQLLSTEWSRARDRARS